MRAEERRAKILEILHGAGGPVSAATLAGQFSVSRQIIVGDIALLRAAGMDIVLAAGVPGLEQSALTGARPGRIIRR